MPIWKLLNCGQRSQLYFALKKILEHFELLFFDPRNWTIALAREFEDRLKNSANMRYRLKYYRAQRQTFSFPWFTRDFRGKGRSPHALQIIVRCMRNNLPASLPINTICLFDHPFECGVVILTMVNFSVKFIQNIRWARRPLFLFHCQVNSRQNYGSTTRVSALGGWTQMTIFRKIRWKTSTQLHRQFHGEVPVDVARDHRIWGAG